jgi:hypothetical protein
VGIVTTAQAEDLKNWYAEDDGDWSALLDAVEAWFRRFICTPDDHDLSLLSVWTVHTHLVEELRTTPRLQLDSTVPESGKTTCLDHMVRLCRRPIMVASPPSPALIPRLLEIEIRTVLIDEVDRVLRPDGPATPDLLSIINSGYRLGATRPALVPTKGGGWEVNEMPTFSPVVLSGNAPMLPDDTRSRIIRILLMPDYGNITEDSDWEAIEAEATELHDRIALFADAVREQVSGLQVDLPEGCVRRSKEKWRPLKRVAVAAGGRWPALVDELIRRSLEEDRAEREDGVRSMPPGMVLLTDLRQIWPDHDDLVPSGDLVEMLVLHNRDYWGEKSAYGKELTQTRMGKILNQAAKIGSARPGGRGPRGYLRKQFEPVWSRLNLTVLATGTDTPHGAPGASGYAGEPGADPHRDSRDNQVHQVHQDPPANMVDDRGDRQAGAEPTAAMAAAANNPDCPGCGHPITPGMAVDGMHPDCHSKATASDAAQAVMV